MTTWEIASGTEHAIVPERKPLRGTSQQEAFWEELLTGSGNVILEARAGSGKSTAMREGMWRLIESGAKPRIRYCAFGRAVADEFRPKCPPGVEVDTTHGFCWRVLQKALGLREVSRDKSYLVLDRIGGKSLAKWKRRTIVKLVGLAKNTAFRPAADIEDRTDFLSELIDQHDIEVWRNLDEVIGWTDALLCESAKTHDMADFDDMLWMTWLLDLPFPRLDHLMIDEVQDLSPVQHLLVPRMNPDGRTEAVGDSYQAIFGFRGADCESISNLTVLLSARTMPLTITFRCPQSHVDLARELVPDFEAAPEAPMGTVESGNLDTIDKLAESDDLVICRCNAPIIHECLRMIANRRPATVRGRAIGDQLSATARRFQVNTIAEFGAALLRWRNERLTVLSAREGVEDKIEAVNDQAACLDAVAESCGSPAEIPDVIDRLFEDSTAKDRIIFSSIHRAKGSEARNVFLIEVPYNVRNDRYERDRPLPDWQISQRRNLRYVGLTRSLDSLYLLEPRHSAKHDPV